MSCEDKDTLLGRLKPVEMNYHQDFCCTGGTREILLKQPVPIGWSGDHRTGPKTGE